MALKIDNSYQTSDALRRYSKASDGQAPFDVDGEPRKAAAAQGEEPEPGMDRVTVSAAARALLAGKASVLPPAESDLSLYNARALTQSE